MATRPFLLPAAVSGRHRPGRKTRCGASVMSLALAARTGCRARNPVRLEYTIGAATCWPATRAPCARWNWPASGAAGDPRCPRAAPSASPAAASWTATARRSPRSPSITATGSTSRRSPSRWTAASPSTPTWSAPRSKAASSTRSAPPPGARSSSATAARSSPRTSTPTRLCGCNRRRRSTCY